jgi:O-antigen ligase
VILVGAAATQSRGGALALACGAVTLTALLGWRPVLRVGWRPAAGGAVAALGLVPSAAVVAPSRPVPAIVALCAGVLLAAWPPRRTRARRPVVAAVALATVALTLIGGGMALRSGPEAISSLESRLNLRSRHRIAQHRVAMAELAAHPVVGTGPGQADLRWREGRRTLRARFVHNEYLQVAVELGLVGGVLLLAMLAAVAFAVWSGRPTGGVRWAGVAAVLVATAVHGGLDFLWHMPVIPFVALLLAGTATVPADEGDLGPEHP